MSVFVLKIIALISMIIDHSAHVYAQTGVDVSVLRAFGRLAYPIYMFLIINGYMQTRSFKRYLESIGRYAIISQFVYSQLFTDEPTLWEFIVKQPFSRTFGPVTITISHVIFAGISLLAVLLLHRTKIENRAFLSFLLLMANFQFYYKGRLIWNNDLNILFTFVCCLVLLDMLSQDKYFYPMQKISLILFIVLLASLSDAGVISCIIVLLSHVFKYNKYAVAIIIGGVLCARNIIVYPSMPIYYCAFIAAAVICIMFYNFNLGPRLKKFFYLAYPGHLLILFIYQQFLC